MADHSSNSEPFKVCPTCGKIWQTKNNFLTDVHVHLLGYQVNFNYPLKGLFIFDHKITNCGTSFALRVKSFESMYNGPSYESLLVLSEVCPGYCLEKTNFERCENKCSMAFVREILYQLKIREEALLHTN